jgi:Rrf2 family protein
MYKRPTELSNRALTHAPYSRSCQHAIAALVHLAKYSLDECASVRDIAHTEEMPAYTLAKLFGRLSRKGVVRSHRGPKGGSVLLVDPAAIRLFDVVCAVDGSARYERCAMGYPTCSCENPCAMHESWKAVRAQIRDFFQLTIADIANAGPEAALDPAPAGRQHPLLKGIKRLPS